MNSNTRRYFHLFTLLVVGAGVSACSSESSEGKEADVTLSTRGAKASLVWKARSDNAVKSYRLDNVEHVFGERVEVISGKHTLVVASNESVTSTFDIEIADGEDKVLQAPGRIDLRPAQPVTVGAPVTFGAPEDGTKIASMVLTEASSLFYQEGIASIQGLAVSKGADVKEDAFGDLLVTLPVKSDAVHTIEIPTKTVNVTMEAGTMPTVCPVEVVLSADAGLPYAGKHKFPITKSGPVTYVDGKDLSISILDVVPQGGQLQLPRLDVEDYQTPSGTKVAGTFSIVDGGGLSVIRCGKTSFATGQGLNLTPGTYKVTVSAPNYPAKSTNITL